MNQGLNRRFVKVSEVASALARLLAKHEGLGVDKSEGINDNLALDGLNGIDDDSDGSSRKLFEGLLRVDIDGREPAAKARVRVIPSDD